MKRLGAIRNESAPESEEIRDSGRLENVLTLHGIHEVTGSAPVWSTKSLRASAPPSIPDPHVHHYHPERDGEERVVLQAFDWNVKPLRESDVQFVAKSS